MREQLAQALPRIGCGAKVGPKLMPPSSEPSASLESMRTRFRERYQQTARFREDRALADPLTEQAEPLLLALAELQPSPAMREALHDAYAALTLLSRRAALLGATASVSVTLIDAIAHGLRAVGVELDAAHLHELSIVAVEGYCAARDERATRELHKQAAESQVALELAPHVRAIVLAGSHDEPDLGPVLERFARELLRDDIRSCLLDLTRLAPSDEELRRALGRFCSQASMLGVQLAVVDPARSLEADLRAWSLAGPQITFFDRYDRAQQAALAVAGLELRFLRRWARLFLPARSGLVR